MSRQRLNDFILIFFVLLLCLGAYLLLFLSPSKGTSVVTIKSEGKIVYSGSIEKDYTLTVKNSALEENTVVIKDGCVFISHSTCPNQYCLRTTLDENSALPIVCLPNKLIVTISKENNETDVVM